MFGNAKLETTYKGLIKSKLYHNVFKNFFTKIMKQIGEKAHNPVTDSLFTIIIALMINSILQANEDH